MKIRCISTRPLAVHGSAQRCTAKPLVIQDALQWSAINRPTSPPAARRKSMHHLVIAGHYSTKKVQSCPTACRFRPFAGLGYASSAVVRMFRVFRARLRCDVLSRSRARVRLALAGLRGGTRAKLTGMPDWYEREVASISRWAKNSLTPRRQGAKKKGGMCGKYS